MVECRMKIFFYILSLFCVLSAKVNARPALKMGPDIRKRIREENEVYGTQLNGNTWKAPLLWPQAKTDTEKMYLLPKELNAGDRINITCMTSHNPQRISISLLTGNSEPDYNNIASQLELHFPSYNSGDEKTTLKTVLNGREEEFITDMRPSDLIPVISNSSFTARMTLVDVNNFYEVQFEIDETHIETISLRHHISNIKYIIVDGDVTKVNRLHFDFA